MGAPLGSELSSERLAARQQELQAEADAVAADLDLVRLLSTRGEAVRVGSAALGLMVLPDLDITVVCPELEADTRRAVAGIGAELAVHDRVRQVTFRDDTGEWNTDPRYPDGLYLNIHYRSRAGRDWTLDIWFVDEPDRQPDLAHARTLPPRLTDAHRAAILRIKQVLASRAGARVPSYEVYRAVLDGEVTTADAFDEWYAAEQAGRPGQE
ncbi:hypothetical protein SLV14_000990 [Streptomyces sp. Je 1-4]|uniref:hypothetical protein n=1 Tax=Streptomyces TaxID=1883 RepID=UPI0021D83902|nr:MULTISPECIES: hypothetical protein [unclassified Streptomyces]UYB38609.1 hypothetical protein SLV14_000990 [Streptomyces sp. Je 1-4]UZQ34577.1 hypothetical protein SLV14N_000990 [Streptomyces sp. Je 1-4] [Streptomyces sp. Je 1-4 4N24]UZQ41995.1 hypothetical protein SLV14NA_000990 [Streptomyces sp. Je 1-4] [Streptomyces sp. Je 1-4 4N24_ara]